MKKVVLAAVIAAAAAVPSSAQRGAAGVIGSPAAGPAAAAPSPRSASIDAQTPARSEPSTEMGRRARQADKVVVATVVGVIADFQTNAFGDRLIVSHADLQVEEALKGAAAPMLSLDVEGGTVGNLTLTVSDMPTIAPGERGVFFVHESRPGVHVPHDRVNSIIKVDRDGRTRAGALTLEDVKLQVQQGLK